MPLYQVLLTAPAAAHAYVEVEAPDEDVALELATRGEYLQKADWTYDGIDDDEAEAVEAQEVG